MTPHVLPLHRDRYLLGTRSARSRLVGLSLRRGSIYKEKCWMDEEKEEIAVICSQTRNGRLST
jgi:hypothetical protein